MPPNLESLSPAETRALAGAATWYAKYHARIIAENMDDPSAAAAAERDDYRDLLAALGKLGIRLRDPLAEAERESQQAA